MKKEILTHLFYLVLFSLLTILLRGWIELTPENAWTVGLFFLGGLIGTLLPDTDHLIYVFILKPQELTSMRVNYMIQKNQIWQTFELMTATREERKGLIFHTAHFQLIFWLLAFLVVSSSGSVFGRGLVLAFSLHLIVDQFLDLMKLDNLDNWFSKLNIVMEKEKYMFYWLANIILLGVFGFIL